MRKTRRRLHRRMFHVVFRAKVSRMLRQVLCKSINAITPEQHLAIRASFNALFEQHQTTDALQHLTESLL